MPSVGFTRSARSEDGGGGGGAGGGAPGGGIASGRDPTASTASASAAPPDSAVYALVVGCGGVISCAGRDKDVRLLDPNDGQCLERMSGHSDRVWALAKTSEETLASGSGDKTIRLWRPADAKCLGTFKGHKGAVMSLLSHRGLLISGSQDQSVRLWDLKEGGCVGSLWQATDGQASKERNSVHSLAIAKRDQLACGTWGGTIRLWDLHRSRCTAAFDAHNGAVWSMLVADGKLFSAGSDGTVKLWDARAGNQEPVGTLGSTSTSGPLYAMVEREGLLLTGGYDQLVKVWDTRMQRCLNELPGHSGSVRCLAFLDSTLLSGSTDGTVRLWDFDSLLAHDATGGATGGPDADLRMGGGHGAPNGELIAKYADPDSRGGRPSPEGERGESGGMGANEYGDDDEEEDVDDAPRTYRTNYEEEA